MFKYIKRLVGGNKTVLMHKGETEHPTENVVSTPRDEIAKLCEFIDLNPGMVKYIDHNKYSIEIDCKVFHIFYNPSAECITTKTEFSNAPLFIEFCNNLSKLTIEESRLIDNAIKMSNELKIKNNSDGVISELAHSLGLK